MRIALACSLELKEQGGTEEDRLLATAIEAGGHQVTIEAWGDARIPWARLDGSLLRSC